MSSSIFAKRVFLRLCCLFPGYIQQQLTEMKIMCEPLFQDDSVLECSSYLRFCQGRNILVDFQDVARRRDPVRYKTDILRFGDIGESHFHLRQHRILKDIFVTGGYCKIHQERLRNELQHMSALQSWGPELANFVSLPERPIVNRQCDRVINKPTFFMKIDASKFFFK